MIRKVFDSWLFPFVICILLAISMRNEYRDNGWRGILEIVGIGIILFIVTFGGIALLFRHWLRKPRS